METILKSENLDFKEDINADKSILIFTMHRSGSMLVHALCSKLCERIAIPYYSANNIKNNKLPESKEILTEEFWKGKKGCFGPIRWFAKVPNIDNYKIILHLRDPRDVLVSMFYSYCYSHRAKIKGYTGYRKEIADNGIDDFVLTLTTGTPTITEDCYAIGRINLMGNVLERYQNYIDNLLYRPNVTFTKYEEMVTDFQNWVNKLLSPFNVADDKDMITKAFVKACKDEFSVSKENVWNHKRRVTPGDYKEKLRPETIAELNRRFENVLVSLNYSIV